MLYWIKPLCAGESLGPEAVENACSTPGKGRNRDGPSLLFLRLTSQVSHSISEEVEMPGVCLEKILFHENLKWEKGIPL